MHPALTVVRRYLERARVYLLSGLEDCSSIHASEVAGVWTGAGTLGSARRHFERIMWVAVDVGRQVGFGHRPRPLVFLSFEAEKRGAERVLSL